MNYVIVSWLMKLYWDISARQQNFAVQEYGVWNSAEWGIIQGKTRAD